MSLNRRTIKALRGAHRLTGHMDALLAEGHHDPVRLFRLARAAQQALSEALEAELAMAFIQSPEGQREMSEEIGRRLLADLKARKLLDNMNVT